MFVVRIPANLPQLHMRVPSGLADVGLAAAAGFAKERDADGGAGAGAAGGGERYEEFGGRGSGVELLFPPVRTAGKAVERGVEPLFGIAGDADGKRED